jgi:hypothetical protein
MIAALYVETDGVYFGLPDVDPWDISRDARLYAGPWPVVAHPPCERWGRYWSGGPSAKERRKLGDDNGCFEAALAAVNRWGGVLEHPEGSHAWKVFALAIPPRAGGWIRSGAGWTCCVEQGHYGHKARKATWLYVRSDARPRELKWGPSAAGYRLDEGYHSTEERRRAIRTGTCQRLSRRQRLSTPPEFRDVLLGIARMAVIA